MQIEMSDEDREIVKECIEIAWWSQSSAELPSENTLKALGFKETDSIWPKGVFEIEIEELKLFPKRPVHEETVRAIMDKPRIPEQPVMINRDNYIIDGLQRIEAAKRLGKKTIKARRVK